MPTVDDADCRLLKLAARQHGAFTVGQAAAAGLSRGAIRHRIESGPWDRVSLGVYRLRGVPVTWELRLTAAIIGSGAGAVASHRSAAQLFGMPGFTGNWVEVTGPLGFHAPLRPSRGHVTRRLPASHIKRINDIPTTSVARTLFDLAGVLNPKQTERALDYCLVRKLVTTPAAWQIYHDVGGAGRRGSRVFRQLLAARGDGYVAPASELERRFINDVILAGGFPMPEREVDLGDADGWIGRVEFVYWRAKLLVEVDGRLHHSAMVDQQRDRDRGNKLTAAGWRILYVDYEMLTQRLPYTRELLRDALQAVA
jgi:hypothetical protein